MFRVEQTASCSFSLEAPKVLDINTLVGLRLEHHPSIYHGGSAKWSVRIEALQGAYLPLFLSQHLLIDLSSIARNTRDTSPPMDLPGTAPNIVEELRLSCMVVN